MDAHPVPVLTSRESAGSHLTLSEPQSPSRGQCLPLNVTSAWDSIQKTSQVENNSKTNAPQQFHSQPANPGDDYERYCLLLFIIIITKTIITITAIGQTQGPKAQATRPPSAPGETCCVCTPFCKGVWGGVLDRTGPSRPHLSVLSPMPSSRPPHVVANHCLKKENPQSRMFCGGQRGERSAWP